MALDPPAATTVGIHLELDRDRAKRLFGARDDTARGDCLQDCAAELSGSVARHDSRHWRALHGLLSGWTSDPAAPEAALSFCVLGGRPLTADGAEQVSLVRPDLVRHCAGALEALTEDDFRERWRAASAGSPEKENEAWTELAGIGRLFQNAAQQTAAVVFWMPHPGTDDGDSA